ncbi:OmpP1/FadL family transporter [Vibrio breoganii]
MNREFEDVWHFGFGGEYKLRNNWALKAGYSYETSPLDDKANQSPDLPVGEQHRYSLGVSKTWDKNTLDIYYEFADFGDMDIAQSGLVKDLNGHFTGKVHFVGLGYTF